MGRFAAFVIVGLGLVVSGAAPASGQDPALRDRVAQLVRGLGDSEPEGRQLAEVALTELGPKALPLLPDAPPKGADPDTARRLVRIRATLERKAEAAALEPSRVTIRGAGLRLTDVLRELQKQSGNTISDLRAAMGGEATDPTFDLALADVPYFEALDAVARGADVGFTFFTGDGSIGLVPSAFELGTGGPEPADGGQTASGRAPARLAGPFRVALKRVATVRDLASGAARGNLQFEIAWEPRLRPMLLSLRADQVRIADDRGQPVAPAVPAEEISTPLRPENPAAELNLNIAAPDRAARALKTVRIKAEVVVPAGQVRFRFPRLAEAAKQTEGGVTIRLDPVEVQENVWTARVRLEMPGGGPAFDSYRQGLFNNRIWLETADGTRFEQNGGFSTLAMGEDFFLTEYLFVDAPGKLSDYTLIFETPRRVATIPIDVTFEDVPLP